MEYEIQFLKALFLTICVEISVLFLLCKVIYKTDNRSNWLILLTGITATVATLPYLWFIVPLFVKSKLWYIIVSEGFAIIAESFIIWGFLKSKYSKALVLSAICNMSSYIIGLMIKFL